MLRLLFSKSRYIVIVPIVGTLIAAFGLMLYETMAMVTALIEIFQKGALVQKEVKALAVGMIEAVDIFLIAIAMYIISVSLFTLFIDDTLPLPQWLVVPDLEAVKANLVSVVIAVLAILFLRAAVAWDGGPEILGFGIAMAMMIAALSLYLGLKGGRKKS